MGILEDQGDAAINAAVCFKSLGTNAERNLRTRMDAWIDNHRNNNWFHGWPQSPTYKECFVFKWDESRVHQRLYGFLCHPAKASPAFQVCVLCIHDTKNQPKTETAILDRVNLLRSAAGVLNALKQIFPD